MPNETHSGIKMDKEVEDKIKDVIKNETVPIIYSNGFICVLGQGDVAILFQKSGVEVGLINLSFTTAKTLAIKLRQLIEFLEMKSERNIMTTEDINVFLTPKENQEDDGK